MRSPALPLQSRPATTSSAHARAPTGQSQRRQGLESNMPRATEDETTTESKHCTAGKITPRGRKGTLGHEAPHRDSQGSRLRRLETPQHAPPLPPGEWQVKDLNIEYGVRNWGNREWTIACTPRKFVPKLLNSRLNSSLRVTMRRAVEGLPSSGHHSPDKTANQRGRDLIPRLAHQDGVTFSSQILLVFNARPLVFVWSTVNVHR